MAQKGPSSGDTGRPCSITLAIFLGKDNQPQDIAHAPQSQQCHS